MLERMLERMLEAEMLAASDRREHLHRQWYLEAALAEKILAMMPGMPGRDSREMLERMLAASDPWGVFMASGRSRVNRVHFTEILAMMPGMPGRDSREMLERMPWRWSDCIFIAGGRWGEDCASLMEARRCSERFHGFHGFHVGISEIPRLHIWQDRKGKTTALIH